MIRYILLGFLKYKPMTGYELKQTIDHSTAHFWHAHHSQIYTTLRQMEAQGLVTSQMVFEEGQPNKRIYQISEAGRKALDEWLAQPLLEMSTIKEELLVRLFFSAQRDPLQVLAELAFQRQLHQQKLAQYQALTEIQHVEENAPALQRDAAFWRATLEMGIRYETTYLGWLEDTMRMIETL